MTDPDTTDPQLYHRISFRNVVGITLLTALIFVLGGVILVQLDPTIFSPERAPLDRLLWFAALFTVGVVASTGYVLAQRTPAGWRIVGLSPVTPRWVLTSVAAGALVFFLGERLDHAFDLGLLAATRANLAPSIHTEVGFLGLLAVFALILPIPLELYFRGVLFNYLNNLFGLQAGIGLSALIYGLTYYNPAAPAYVSYGVVHGAVLAALYARSGSLWTAMAANGTLGAFTVAKAAWG